VSYFIETYRAGAFLGSRPSLLFVKDYEVRLKCICWLQINIRWVED